MFIDNLYFRKFTWPRELPKIKIINKHNDIFSYQYKDIQLINYDPYEHIKASVSV